MIIRSISGADIDATMTNSMQSTLNALVEEKLLTEEAATEFLNTHVCLTVNSDDSVWFRIRKFLNWPDTQKDAFRPVVFKISQKP
jgi:hypothetical protein